MWTGTTSDISGLLTFKLLRNNVPLSQWKTFKPEERYSYGGANNAEKVAKQIFAQLSHIETVNLVAKEFERYPSDLRLILRTLCNTGNCSGNVRKNIQRLNELMGGKLLREDEGRTFNVRKESKDGAFYKKVKVNEAVAGAKRKYGKL